MSNLYKSDPTALLLLTVLLLAGMGSEASAQQKPYWNDLEVYRLNRLQPHDRIVPDGEQWRICLDGTWAFDYYSNPAEAWAAGLQPQQSIRVPGNIELQGYGVPVYVNMKNEFPSDPPNVPVDYNPVGTYARSFSLPASWEGRRTIVKVGAAGGGLYLYVNGTEVGYSEDSKTPAEWDITRYLKPGNNRLAMRVVRWSNGSYLECQDMWRMSGITRSVELYSVPPIYLSDLRLIADIDTADWSTGLLDVMVDLSREVQGGSVDFELTAPDGSSAGRARYRLEPRDWFASVMMRVDSVSPWTDSTPTLYTLGITLRDASGRATEQLTKRVGFRHVDIKDGQLRVNGRAVEIRGVNRHEHSMYGGHYVSPDEMRRDVAMMKEMGVNAVRTCHYPDDELWYDLCDSAGLYVWDEANAESHAQGYGEHSLAKKTEWLNPILNRVFNMFRRDRNHACVIVWSLGNECGNGYCFEEAYRFLKSKDATRPVSYERAELDWNTDIVGIMYPSVEFLSSYARSAEQTRPYIMVEYCHAMGNSMGGLRDYWDTIDKYPQLQGGFVWDWMDQAFLMRGGHREWTDDGRGVNLGADEWWAAGGDLGQLPGIVDDGDFCANGLLAADGTPHPHAAELAAVYTRGRGNVEAAVGHSGEGPQWLRRSEGLYRPLKVSGSRRRGDRQWQSVTIVGGHFSIELSGQDGSLTSYRYRDAELLAAPLRCNFWRPPTDNDLVDVAGARAWQGLDALHREVQGLSIASTDTVAEVQIDMRLVAADGSAMRVRQVVQVAASGAVQLSYLVMPDGQFATLPKVGVQLGLDTAYEGCSFYGNIFETYPDRRTARRVGEWYKSMADLAAPQYVMPQEQGNREARTLRFKGEGRVPINVTMAEGWLNFSVRRYADAALTAARRWSDVGRPDPYYTLSIDHRVAPLGTATCGPGVARRHVLSGDSVYRYTIMLVPGDAGVSHVLELPVAVYGQDLPADEAAALVGYTLASATEGDTPYSHPAIQMASCRRAAVGDWQGGWFGYSGRDSVVYDLTLDHPASLATITLGSCHSPADWVLRPLAVEARHSRDGKRWSSWQSLEPIGDEGDLYGGSRRVTYRAATQRARKVEHVQLRVVCRRSLPPWHPYAGQPAWVMIDGIRLTAKDD